MGGAVLAFRSVAQTIGEDGFEQVEIGSINVGPLIYHEAGQVLAYALAHESGLVVINGEPFFHEYGGGVDGESLGGAGEVFASGEGEVIGIAGVFGAGCFRESR